MSYLVSIGTAVPEYTYAQADLAEFMIQAHQFPEDRSARKLRLLYQKTHIHHRHSVLPDFGLHQSSGELFRTTASPKLESRMEIYQQEALPLATKAAHACLPTLSEEADDITHLITVTCTGLHAPGLEITLAEELGLRPDITRLAVNFIGCYAAFHALKLAEMIGRAEPHAKVLIVCVELCTIHFQRLTEKDHLLANALFADGAAAALICGAAAAQAYPQKLRLKAFHHTIAPKGRSDMAWRLSSHGFLMRLSSYIPELVQDGLAPLTAPLWEQLNLQASDIHHWAVHPGGRRILEACLQVFGLERERLAASFEVLSKYGNMSSPTVLFVLQHLWDHQLEWTSGEHLMATGFGPGLTMEAAVMEVA